MRILFDGQQLSRQMTGVGYYTDRVLRSMLVQDRSHEWAILCVPQNGDYVREIAALNPRAGLVCLKEALPLDFRIQQGMLGQFLGQHPTDLFFSPSFLAAPKEVCRSISAVHDATYVLFPEFHGGRVAEYLHRCVASTCANASAIVTMSENSRRDIARFYHYPADRIRVIPLAADAEFARGRSAEELAAVRERHKLPGRYVLAVNMGNPKKNVATLLEAYAGVAPAVRSACKLVIVGEWSPGALDIPALVDRNGLRGDVLLTGFVSREDLYGIYAGAELFCFPSHHEGFGLPVVEAMAAGVPVISSDAASLPEVAGGAALLVGSKDAAAWAREIERLLESPEARATLAGLGRSRAAEFSWERTGQATLAVISEVSAQHAPALRVTAPGRDPEHEPDKPHFDEVAFAGLCCAITVDDVRPEPGFGGRRAGDTLGMLLKLYEELGTRFTLFVPTDWKGAWPVAEHLDWLGWLLEQPCFEVACHGHLHAVAPGSDDPGEFRGIESERLDEILGRSIDAFAKRGHRPQGIRAPGWFLERSGYGVFSRRFRYVADHFRGTTVQRLAGERLLRFPYTYTIDQLGSWPRSGLVVLQSHVAPEGRTTNGWGSGLYEAVHAFVKAGRGLGARFVTLGELTESLAGGGEPTGKESENASKASQPVVVATGGKDIRLHRGEVKVLGSEAGVLYNPSGDGCRLKLSAENAGIAILSRNRREYLMDLLASIDATAPASLGRLVLLNNSEDDSREHLGRRFPHWRVIELKDADHRGEPAGLEWLKRRMPELLPGSVGRLGSASGWTMARGVAWLRNRQLAECGRDFLISFDDDFVVKPGWWQYYLRFQHEFQAHAVINNFGAFLLCRTVPERIGWFDERFLSSHGYEDNDYAARMAEAGIRWVLGFNVGHDWRSAEEGNPRGSMTGADYFVHRYALRSGGYSARRDEGLADPVRAAWNARWFRAKWQETREDTGIFTRPPFNGTYLRRLVAEEPDWSSVPAGAAALPGPGVKVRENTPVSEIDPVANPQTGTMVDRYTFASHWCKGRRVLDAACGHGYGAALLLALGAGEVVGADLDPEALEFAEEHYAGPRISFVRLDLANGCSGTVGRFPAVVSIETMEHLPRELAGKYLATLRACVEPGGTVFLTTPQRTELTWVYRGGTHRYEYSREEFQSLVGAAFAGCAISFLGIEEFRAHEEPRLYSRLTHRIDGRTRIMIAVVTAAGA
ncbi:MAG TPA: glycosyltransferase [Planctomycetota bacterium]|nr:glycosyltransferase [Planctomycetota bacterium]